MNFTSDLQWDCHFSHVYMKMCRSMSFVKRLKTNSNHSDIIWQAYLGLVFCHLSYCWPIMCDISCKFFKKFEQIDRLAMKWANVKNISCLRRWLDKSCKKLIYNISKSKSAHPLCQFFIVRDNLNNVRRKRIPLPLQHRSSLYNKSFIKYSSVRI